MSIEIIVPRLGWSMDEGAFCRWLKQEGELVREGDELFELEGDKATQVVESFDTGILHFGSDGPQPGDSVKVGQVLGHLHPKAGGMPTASVQTPKTRAATIEPAAKGPTSTALTESEATARPTTFTNASTTALHELLSHIPIASPSIRRLARQLNVDLQAPTPGTRHPAWASELLQSTGDYTLGAERPTRQTVSRERHTVTPRAIRLAAELGVNIPDVIGTGKNGRVRERDVRGVVAAPFAASNNAATPPKSVRAMGSPISATRRLIAERMMAASGQTAAVTLSARADASELVKFREECKRAQPDRGQRIPSYTDLFVKLSAAALERHPACTIQWINDSIVVPDGIHVSVAVDTPQGLVTPVVRDVPLLSLRELSERLAELVELARSRRLPLEQMQGGVFTVSSLGASRVEAFTPILNPPQTAILGVGRIAPAPIVRDDSVVVSQMVALSLTFDHRVIDGVPAAALLTKICEVIERPLPWLLT